MQKIHKPKINKKTDTFERNHLLSCYCERCVPFVVAIVTRVIFGWVVGSLAATLAIFIFLLLTR